MISLVLHEKTRRRGRQYAELAYMTTVTALLLALVADGTHEGVERLPELLVYAFATGFGLEFVAASWRGRWTPGDGDRQLHR